MAQISDIIGEKNSRDGVWERLQRRRVREMVVLKENEAVKGEISLSPRKFWWK